MLWLAIPLLWVCNVLDAYFTWLAVCHLKIAGEANPVMKFLIDLHPLAFVLIKVFWGTLCCWILWNLKDRLKSYPNNVVKIVTYSTIWVVNLVYILICSMSGAILSCWYGLVTNQEFCHGVETFSQALARLLGAKGL